MPLAKDLLHPQHHEEKRKHKLKRLVQHPNSYFMDVKCPGCYRSGRDNVEQSHLETSIETVITLGTVLNVAVSPLDGVSGVNKDVKQYGLRGSLVLIMA